MFIGDGDDGPVAADASPCDGAGSDSVSDDGMDGGDGPAAADFDTFIDDGDDEDDLAAATIADRSPGGAAPAIVTGTVAALPGDGADSDTFIDDGMDDNDASAAIRARGRWATRREGPAAVDYDMAHWDVGGVDAEYELIAAAGAGAPPVIGGGAIGATGRPQHDFVTNGCARPHTGPHSATYTSVVGRVYC